MTPSPKINTTPLISIGYKFSEDIFDCGDLKVFSWEYFCPQNFRTGDLNMNQNTYSIHHYDCSWYGEIEILSSKLKHKFMKFLPIKFSGRLAHFIAISKYEGVLNAVKRTYSKWKG